MNLINKILQLFNKKEKLTLLFLFILMFIAALFETLGIGLIVPFVAIVTNPDLIHVQPILSYIYQLLNFKSTTGFLVFATVFLLSVFIIKNLYLLIFQYLQYRFIYNQQIKQSQRLLNHYLTSPYEFHLQRNTSELLRNVNTEISRVFNQILIPVFLLITEILVITSIFSLLIINAPIETLLSAAILGGSVGIFLKVFRNKLSNSGKVQQQTNGQMIKWINQGLGSVKEVKVSGREKFFIESFVEQSEKFSNSMRFFQILNQVPRLYIETIVVTTILFTMLLIILQGNDTTTLLSTMALFAMGAFRLMPSINRVIGAITSIRFNLPALNVIYKELIEEKHTNIETADLQEEVVYEPHKRIFNKGIQLQDISYKYPNQKDFAIKNVSLNIPIGKSVAFIGASGAGKTTIVDIILGLLEPQNGKVLVDGTELKEQLSLWKKKIGYIPQSIYLSDDSIRRNVAFGIKDSEIDDAAVRKAIQDAQLIDFVEGLPEGLDTFVGERGVRLSGGQRQRIGIARALYHNPEILFLDEATSALDNDTEKEIMKAIDGLKGEKTLIIIAHRLSTIEKCDEVFKIVDGSIEVRDKVLAN